MVQVPEWSRAENERFQVLLESAPDAVVIVDAAGRITLVNQQTEKLFGYRREELLGQPVEMLVPQPLRRAHAAQRNSYSAHPHARPMGSGLELHGMRKDGTQFPVEISLSPARTATGLEVFSTIRDISDRRRLETELRRAKQQLEARIQQRTDELAQTVQSLQTEVAERQRSEEATERLAAIVESSDDAIIGETLDGTILTWNGGAQRLYGYSPSETRGRSVKLLAPPDRVHEMDEILGRLRVGERMRHFETVRVAKDGRRVDISLSVFPVLDGAGTPIAAATIARDITDRKRLERQLLESHKMEAIGRLAGGVAHDFNNLLGVVLGASELLVAEREIAGKHRNAVEGIREAAQRGASLTCQLLTFSRQQLFEPRILDLNAALDGVKDMLGRLVGPEILLHYAQAPQLDPVRADPSQMLQVILNLVANARDAMPEGGLVRIETANVKLDEAYANAHPGTRPGSHVMLSIADNGPGMNPEVLSHIFEPFFTTKKGGQGTGLGLATAYGIIQQSGGSIWAYSEEGRGTLFKIFLPATNLLESGTQPAEAEEEEGLERLPRGNETVLLVEDSRLLLEVTSEFLTRLGYSVLPAEDGEAALTVAQQHPGEIHLLLTDLAMPGMNGRQLSERLVVSRPALKLLYTSGYAGPMLDERRLPPGEDCFLEKPYTWQSLASKVRRVLDRQ